MDTTYYARLAWKNWATTVTASSQQATMPSSNLLNNQPFLPWRSTSNADQTLSGNFSGILPVSYLCIYNHNFSYMTKVRLQLYAEDAQSTLLYDNEWDATSPTYGLGDKFGLYFGGYTSEGFLSPFSIYFFDAIPAKSFKVTLSAISDASYYQAGIFRIGQYWQPEQHNIAWGYSAKREDDSRQTPLENGSVYTDKKPSWRTMNLKFDYLTESDEVEMWNLQYTNGKSIPLLVSVYPAGNEPIYRNHTMFAVLSDWSEVTRNEVCARSFTLSLREVI